MRWRGEARTAYQAWTTATSAPETSLRTVDLPKKHAGFAETFSNAARLTWNDIQERTAKASFTDQEFSVHPAVSAEAAHIYQSFRELAPGHPAIYQRLPHHTTFA
jgi:hypothetical protein